MKQDYIYDDIWLSIRLMGYFSVLDLMLLIKNKNKKQILKNYLKFLTAYGIIKKLRNGNYVLVNNLGYKTPKIITRSFMLDPNSNRIFKEETYENRLFNV